MTSLVFHRGLRLCSSSLAERAPSCDNQCGYDFLSFLAMAQKLNVDFLPTTWYSGSSLLGEGGTAQVHQSQLDITRGLAFKKLSHASGISEEQQWECLINELMILKMPGVVGHPNIAQLIGIAWEIRDGTDGIWPVLVSERAQLGTLNDYFQQIEAPRRHSHAERLRFCLEIAEAIQALHNYNVIHGDLKPENILVAYGKNEIGVTKLLDFGYSRIGQAESDRMCLPMTMPWQPPEYASKEGTFLIREAKQADVYSFCLLCVWLLSYDKLVQQWREGTADERKSAIHQIERLKKEQTLQSKLCEIVEDEEDMDSRVKLLLQKILRTSLCQEFSERPRISMIVAMIQDTYWTLSSMTSRLLHKAASIIQPLMTSSIENNDVPKLLEDGKHECFIVADGIEEIEAGDYMVSQWIFHCLQDRSKSNRCTTCKERASFQLAICFRIGFGTRISKIQGLLALQKTSKSEQELEEATSIKAYAPKWRKALPGIDFPANMVDLMREQHRLEIAETFITGLIEDRERTLGIEHTSTIRLKSQLSSILTVAGKFRETEVLDREIVELSKAVSGGHAKASSMANLARTLTHLGKWTEAEHWLKKSMSAQKWLPGSTKTALLSDNDLLALIYRYQGKWAESTKLQTQNLEMRRSALGPEHPDTIDSMIVLASCYSGLDRHADAEQLEEESVKLRSKVLGLDHPSTLHATGNLCITKYNQGRKQEAIQEMSRVVKKFENTLGSRHPETLSSQKRLANMHFWADDWKDALKLQERVLATTIEVLGPDHYDTMRSYSDLANTYHAVGNLGQSEKHYLKALEDRGRISVDQPSSEVTTTLIDVANKFLHKKEWTEDEEEEVQVLSKLASLWREQGRLQEAEHLLLPVVEGRRRVLGIKDNSTLISMAALADVYTSQEKFEEAETLQVQILEMRTLERGEFHLSNVEIMSDLVDTYRGLKNWERADEMMEKALKIATKSMSPQAPLLSKLTADVAMSYMRRNDWDCAQVKIQEAYDMFASRPGGSEHPNALELLGLMAECKKCQGGWGDAAKIEVGIVEGMSKVLGPDSPRVLKAKFSLAKTYWELRREAEARELLQGIIERSEILFGPDASSTLNFREALLSWDET